jgi:asparagine synthase (glutamine-hydrolysing)
VCGFAGELTTDGPADVAVVWRMAGELQRRGPDGAGAWASGPVALAHRRLSIIDLSERGAQPMVDADLGVSGVFNGIIYNHRELREELTGLGHRFFSTSDTEVLLKAWREWGDRFVERLYGMFAFCLVDTTSGRALLGRDRLGIKPLYLAELPNGTLRFASTLPALVAGGGVDTSIDRVALHHYLSWHAVVPPPHTILNGVRKLEPATLLAIEPDGRRTTTKYWEAHFGDDQGEASWTSEDWENAVLDALRAAVKRRMVADVPVGVLLSGGLDSSLIVALLAEQGQTGLTTFSIGFQDRGGIVGDEFRYSDIVAREFGTDHRQIRIDNDQLLPALPDAVRNMSEPMVSHDAVAFFLLSQAVAREIKVVQSGQGADEVLAGYSWYQEIDDDEGHAVELYHRHFFDREHDEINAIISPDLRLDEDVSQRFVAEHFAKPGAAHAVDRALRIDTEVMLVDDPVKRLDNMSMAWGLEARVPFLDHEVVELAARCPLSLKLAEDGKGVLKRASRSVLPLEVVDRPKGYFPVPALKHFEGGFLELVGDVMTSERARSRGIFEREHVDTLLAEPNEHKTNLGASKLWQVALLELWFQQQGL